MKTSNKILLYTGMAIVLLLILLVIVLKYCTNVSSAFNYDNITTLNYNFTNFESLKINKVWQLEIKQASAYSVAVEVPENLKDFIKIEQQNSSLVFDLVEVPENLKDLNTRVFDFNDFKKKIKNQKLNIKAKLTMPSLKEIKHTGLGEIILTDFKEQILKIDTNGVGNIIVNESIFENVDITLSGVGYVDLKGSKCKNANVYLFGIGSIILTMDGGKLTGRHTGLGNIEYYGQVTNLAITKTGFGLIEKR